MSGWGRTLNTGIAATIEQALNRALALDPASGKALRELLDEPFLIQLEPPGLELYLSADSRALRVQFSCTRTPALTLAGSPLGFAAAALGDENIFRDGRVSLNGDVARAHRFQRILQQLDPDWEASLAEVIGSVPAHFIARRVRQGLSWSQGVRRSLNRNIEEYLQEESDTLPARAEAEALFEDIDALRLDTDRLTARLHNLETARHSRSSPAREAKAETGAPRPEEGL